MQVVEDVEEGLLGLGCFAGPELYVVDDEHVDHLVEVDEVVGGAGAARFGILLHELLAGDIEHGLVGVHLFGLKTDGIGQVGLAEAHAAVQQQGVEAGLARFLGHGVAGRACQAVAVALDKVLQRVVGAQLRVDAHLLDAWKDEGVGYLALAFLINIDGQVGERVACRPAIVRRQGGHQRVGGDGLVHHDAVFQHTVGAQLHAYDALEQVDIVLLDPFVEERARHLHDECRAVELQGDDGGEPCLVGLAVLGAEGIFDDVKTFRPYSLVIFLNHFSKTLLFSITYTILVCYSLLAKVTIYLCTDCEK